MVWTYNEDESGLSGKKHVQTSREKESKEKDLRWFKHAIVRIVYSARRTKKI